MAAQGTAPVSVDNLAQALAKVGGVETLWTGKAYSANVPGASECSVLHVVIGSFLSSSPSDVITILPGVLNGASIYAENQRRAGASLSGDTITGTGSYGAGSPAIWAVRGLRSGGGQLVADLLDLLREVG